MTFQAIVSQFFQWQTSVVVRWPLPFLVFPPILSILLVSLAAYDFRLNVSKETLQVFLPDDMPSLTALKELMRLFPPRDPQRDTYSVLGSKFAYFVLEATDGNVLSNRGLEEVRRIHGIISKIKTFKGETLNDICLREPSSGCLLHPLLFAISEPKPLQAARFFLRYPIFRFGHIVIDNALVFGGLKTNKSTTDRDGNSAIISATAIRIVYPLDNIPESTEWIKLFLKSMNKLKLSDGFKLYRTSSSSLPMEMERNGALLIPWMPWSCLFLVLFCMWSCSSGDQVRSQPWIGFFAMFNATMATVASTAFLIWLRYPFLPLVFIMPFLVVSIGVDNMFLMLRSWRLTYKSDAEERFISALTETAASLFITSLTDGLSFSIGTISDFHAVRVFCTYCSMAILFMFFYQISFFNAVMVFCCRREAAGRHWLFFWRKIGRQDILASNERSIASRALPPKPSSSTASRFAAFIGHPAVKIVVILFYLLYLTTSVYYSLKFPLGLDIKLLTPDNSYVAQELSLQERLFTDFGPYCFAVVKFSSRKRIEDGQVRREILHLYRELSSSEFASKGEFWLEDFEKVHGGKNYKREDILNEIYTFLATPENNKFRNDIRFSLNGTVEAAKLLMRTRKLGPTSDSPRAEYLREVMERSDLDGFVYDTGFLLVDQQSTTVFNVISNVVSAMISMLGICILMVPRPISAMCIAVSILSINVGVVGALSFAGTRLDIISMITIVMSIGFSVDYVTHSTFHFVTQHERRVERCLHVMTQPILQSGLSTICGVLLLAFVPAYIVRTFVLTVLFVVCVGMLHGLIFLPVLLDTVVPLSEYLPPYNPDDELKI